MATATFRPSRDRFLKSEAIVSPLLIWRGCPFTNISKVSFAAFVMLVYRFKVSGMVRLPTRSLVW